MATEKVHVFLFNLMQLLSKMVLMILPTVLCRRWKCFHRHVCPLVGVAGVLLSHDAPGQVRKDAIQDLTGKTGQEGGSPLPSGFGMDPHLCGEEDYALGVILFSSDHNAIYCSQLTLLQQWYLLQNKVCLNKNTW